MSKEGIDEGLLRYLEGEMSAEESAEIEQQLRSDERLSQRLEQLRILLNAMSNAAEQAPPAAVRWQFEAALQEERSRTTPRAGKVGWRVAATVTLLVLGFAGGRLSTPTLPNSDLLALQSEVSNLRQAVMQSTLHSPSASERIRTVNLIGEEVRAASPELLRTLINTVKGDESPNVRYAAVQALEPYMTHEKVRLELVSALQSQTDPILQIAIMNWLVEAEEQAAIGAIKKLIKKEQTSPEVKQQGQLAIDILI